LMHHRCKHPPHFEMTDKHKEVSTIPCPFYLITDTQHRLFTHEHWKAHQLSAATNRASSCQRESVSAAICRSSQKASSSSSLDCPSPTGGWKKGELSSGRDLCGVSGKKADFECSEKEKNDTSTPDAIAQGAPVAAISQSAVAKPKPNQRQCGNTTWKDHVLRSHKSAESVGEDNSNKEDCAGLDLEEIQLGVNGKSEAAMSLDQTLSAFIVRMEVNFAKIRSDMSFILTHHHRAEGMPHTVADSPAVDISQHISARIEECFGYLVKELDWVVYAISSKDIGLLLESKVAISPLSEIPRIRPSHGRTCDKTVPLPDLLQAGLRGHSDNQQGECNNLRQQDDS